jgi:hypothetical protein
MTMTSTRHPRGPGRRGAQARRHLDSTASPGGRDRRRSPLRSLATAIPPIGLGRPATVWPCAQDDHREGTALLAAWLLTAVVKIVTTYSDPGHRVLLVGSADDLTPASAGHLSGVFRTPRRPGPYAGLTEAAWTVVRLGRGIATRTAGPVDDGLADTLPLPIRSESGPEPDPIRPDSEATPGPDSDTGTGSDRVADAPGPDRFDVIITAAGPDMLDGLRPTRWAPALAQHGILAVITHSENREGRLHDRTTDLVRAARHAGLRYLDHVILLQVPVRNGVITPRPAAADDHSQPRSPRCAAAVAHTRTHADLLVFTTATAVPASAAGTGSSDD